MAQQRRTFQPEFKLRVAKMITEQGLSISQVSKDMNLSETTVRTWVTQLRADTQGTLGMGKPITPEQLRIRQLEQENRQLKQDNELLKNPPPGAPRSCRRTNSSRPRLAAYPRGEAVCFLVA